MEASVGLRVQATTELGAMFDTLPSGSLGTITKVWPRGLVVKWDVLTRPMGVRFEEVEVK